MDITKSNFKLKIEEIEEAISNATFVAIDCEFSGLKVDSNSNINPYDSYEDYYEKLKRSISQFLVFQFGLCTFRYDKNEKKFKQKCYNFYLFPRPTVKYIPDRRFICQASSIDFLANHDFNFNKVFKEGISYLNEAEAAVYRENIEEKFKEKESTDNGNGNGSDQNNIPIPNEDKSFITETMKLIEVFISSNKDELMLPQCNAFRRRLIYQEAKVKFGSTVGLETRIVDNKDRILFAQKPQTPEQKAKKKLEKFEQSLEELDEAVGFSKIIQFLVKSRKLVVGHNLCSDLLHIIDKFLTPLPSYSEFKECANCFFPKIVDTKYMASSGIFKEVINNTVLGNMVNILKCKPFEIPKIEVDENAVGYTLSDDKEHESGFDAFLTGISFLTMVKYLHKSDNFHEIIEKDSESLTPYINKLFLLKFQEGYINLMGNDLKLNRDHVLHISFPKAWKTNDIIQLFHPFGSIHIAWIDNSNAYVALHKRNQVKSALKSLSKNKKYTLTSYASYQANIKSQKREADSPLTIERKKRRINSEKGESSKNKNEPESLAAEMIKLFEENSTWN